MLTTASIPLTLYHDYHDMLWSDYVVYSRLFRHVWPVRPDLQREDLGHGPNTHTKYAYKVRI